MRSVAGLAKTTQLVGLTSGAGLEAVQRFIAYGQLCHLIGQVGLYELDTSWAHPHPRHPPPLKPLSLTLRHTSPSEYD